MALLLRFISGKYAGAEYPLPETGEVLIGRAPELPLVLAEDMVSRKHARLVIDATGVVLVDLGSTNGTYINGERIGEARVSVGDRVLMGDSIMRLISPEEATFSGDQDTARVALRDLGKRRRTSASMSGDLKDIPLPDLLTLFSTNKRTGMVSVVNRDKAGTLVLRDGQLLQVRLDAYPAMAPLKALVRMAAWKRGTFSFEEQVIDAGLTPEIPGRTEAILMEALRQVDELSALLPQLPPPETTFRVSRGRIEPWSAFPTPALDMLQDAHAGASCREIVDRAALTDLEAAELILSWLGAGVIAREEG